MHYYKKNIGDYRSATAHLTLLEHGVYNWLLDTYYLNEKPLPGNERELFRLALARTDEEKQAVRDVLDEYFENTENGWVHNRCEKEIKAYHAKAETNRKNGGKGGRPKGEQEQSLNNTGSNAEDKQKETQSDNSGNPHADDNSEQWNPNTEHLKTILRSTAYSIRADEIVSMPDFEFHLGNFNAHWENKIDLTENQRTRKFAAWLIQEFEKLDAKKKREAEQKNKQPVPRHRYGQGAGSGQPNMRDVG